MRLRVGSMVFSERTSSMHHSVPLSFEQSPYVSSIFL
jgi:hypothetical protein